MNGTNHACIPRYVSFDSYVCIRTTIATEISLIPLSLVACAKCLFVDVIDESGCAGLDERCLHFCCFVLAQDGLAAGRYLDGDLGIVLNFRPIRVVAPFQKSAFPLLYLHGEPAVEAPL